MFSHRDWSLRPFSASVRTADGGGDSWDGDGDGDGDDVFGGGVNVSNGDTVRTKGRMLKEMKEKEGTLSLCLSPPCCPTQIFKVILMDIFVGGKNRFFVFFRVKWCRSSRRQVKSATIL
jgi:hypothetical protein